MGRAVWFALLVVFVASILWTADALLHEAPASYLPTVALDPSRERPQGGFYRCPVEEPTTMNPFVGHTAVLRQYVLAFTHDALAEYDARDASLRPALLAFLPQQDDSSGDANAWLCTLREDLTFSDGRPLTAADVRCTYDFAQLAELDSGEIVDAVRSVAGLQVLDDRRFRVDFGEFHFAALERFLTQFRIVQADWFERQLQTIARQRGLDSPQDLRRAGDARATRHLRECLTAIRTPGPGTGPYRFHDDDPNAWRAGVSLTMTQNPHSWRRRAEPLCWNLAGIQLLFDPQLAGSVLAALDDRIDFLAGALDFDRLLVEHDRLRERFRLEEYVKLRAALLLIVWNCQRAPFDSPEVRRALTMLFDRQKLLDALLQGHGQVATSWFRPGAPELPADLSPRPFDPISARRLLDAAGIGELQVPILCVDDLFRRMLTLAQEDFARAGVTLRIEVAPWDEVQRRLQAGEFDGGVALLHNHAPIQDPGEWFHSARSARFGGFRDAAFDQLVERATREPSAEQRRELFHDVARSLHENQPVTELLYPSVRVLLHRRYDGVEVGPLGLYPKYWWTTR